MSKQQWKQVCVRRVLFILLVCIVPSHVWAGGPPAAKVKELKNRIKKTNLIAKQIKLTLQLGHLYRKYKAYDKAITVFRGLGQKYDKSEVRCVTTHFWAQSLLSQQKKTAAHVVYRTLMKKFRGCRCRYLPNAYIALGRAAFDQKQYKSALRLYKKAPRCRKNRIAAIASAYMTGWCSYKLGRYAQSLRSLVRSLRQLRNSRRRFRGKQAKKLEEIQKEALPNLVRAFNRAGQPNRALRTFRQVASPKQVEKMLKQLSDSYHTTKNYRNLLGLYQQLARSHRRSPRQVRDWLEILRASYRTKNDRVLMGALTKVVKVSLKYGPKAGNDATLKRDLKDVEDQLYRFAMSKHRTAQNTSNKKLYRQSEKFFRAYRKLFPKAKKAQKMAYWHGEVLLHQEQFAQAARAFRVCAEGADSFKFKRDATYKVALARHRLLNHKQALRYRSPKKNSRPKALPKQFQHFIRAGKFYRTNYPKDKQVPYVTYNMGLVYQQFGHWKKARRAFVSIVKTYPKTRYARPSAYHVVDTLRVRQRWQLLHKWTKTFGTLPSFGTPLFKKSMLSMSRAAQMKSCFVLDTAKKYVKAAICYRTMAASMNKHKDIPMLLYNGYVAFHNGKKVNEAQAMKKELLKRFPQSKPARMLKR